MDNKVEVVDNDAPNDELLNIEKDVMDLEKSISDESSRIVDVSSCSTTDQTMFLQPSSAEEEITEDDITDANDHDCQYLEEELHLSEMTLDDLIPKTKLENELAESSDCETSENVTSDSSIHNAEINLNNLKVDLEDSEIIEATTNNTDNFEPHQNVNLSLYMSDSVLEAGERIVDYSNNDEITIESLKTQDQDKSLYEENVISDTIDLNITAVESDKEKDIGNLDDHVLTSSVPPTTQHLDTADSLIPSPLQSPYQSVVSTPDILTFSYHTPVIDSSLSGTDDSGEGVKRLVSDTQTLLDDGCMKFKEFSNEAFSDLNELNEQADTLLDITEKARYCSSELHTKILTTPKTRRRKIERSPLLRRKVIKECVNLHNQCETSEVLKEITRPTIKSTEVVRPVTVNTTNNSRSLEMVHKTEPEKEGIESMNENPSLSDRFSGPAMAWFPWKTLSFFLLVSTAAIINLDVERSGGTFSKSNTGQFLTDVGQYDNVMTGYLWCLQTGESTKLWADTNIPVYYNQMNKVSGPYIQMASEGLNEAGAMVSLGLNKMGQMYESGLDWLESVVPGVKVQVASIWSHLQKFFHLALARGQEVINLLVVKFNHLIRGEIDWSASFNNLRKQMVSAVNYIQVQVNQLVK